MARKTILVALIITGVIIQGAGCAQSSGKSDTSSPSSSPTVAPTPTTPTVLIKKDHFEPAVLTVTTGQAVTWLNRSTVPQTVMSGTPQEMSSLFNSGPLTPGATFSFPFGQPGEYPYHSMSTPEFSGKIVVK